MKDQKKKIQTKYIEQLLWRSPPTKKRQTDPEENIYFEKWRQDVPWLETIDKRTEMCTHVHCAPRTHTGERCHIRS